MFNMIKNLPVVLGSKAFNSSILGGSSLDVVMPKASEIFNMPNEMPALSYEAQDIDDFVAKLDEALKEVREASKISQELHGKVGELREDLDSRSIWDQVKGSFTGENDKNLATMVQRLVASLQLTQSAVNVLFTVQGQKHKTLHQFNEVLVNKISAVAADTVTLSASQRASVLRVLGSLKNHVDEQLKLHAQADRNEETLKRHAEDLTDCWKGVEQINGGLTKVAEAQNQLAEAHTKLSQAQEQLTEDLQKTAKQSEDLKKALNVQLESTEKSLQEKLQTTAEHLSQTHEKAVIDISLQYQNYHSSVEEQLSQLQRMNAIQLKEISQLEAQVKTLQSEQLKRSRTSLLMSILCSILVSVAVGATLLFFL